MKTFRLKPGGPGCRCPFFHGQRIFDQECFFAGVVREINYDSENQYYSATLDTGQFYWASELDTACRIGIREDTVSGPEWAFNVPPGTDPESIFESLYEDYEGALLVEALEEQVKVEQQQREPMSIHDMTDAEFQYYHGHGALD